MIIRITRAATSDLEAIGDYIARRNPGRAVSFIQELRRACLDLADHPEAFPVPSRYAHLHVRRRVHGAYLIFYRIDDGIVSVLHVLHASRDQDETLFPSYPE